MIAYQDVVNAMNRLSGFREGFPMGALEKQLTLSLKVYHDRGEYDGTVESAYECLERACYELVPLNIPPTSSTSDGLP